MSGSGAEAGVDIPIMLGAETSAAADFGFSGALPPLTIKGSASGAASAASGDSSCAACSFAADFAGAELAEPLVVVAVGFEIDSFAVPDSAAAIFEGALAVTFSTGLVAAPEDCSTVGLIP